MTKTQLAEAALAGALDRFERSTRSTVGRREAKAQILASIRDLIDAKLDEVMFMAKTEENIPHGKTNI